MDYQALRYEVKDAVATITLNRPEAMNALDLAMSGELIDRHAELNIRAGRFFGPGSGEERGTGASMIPGPLLPYFERGG